MSLIQLDGLVKSYQIGMARHTALNQVSLSVSPGELLAIVGASGSGKSTLMNMVGLLDTPDNGAYYLNQQLISDLSTDELAKLRNRLIGFIFQQYNLLPRFTAEQNVALPLIYRGESAASISTRVNTALTRVGMAPFKLHKPNQLSGGQQQRVAIARALVGSPQVILADEPTGSLDSQTGQDILQLFLSLHQEGRTIILVTHDERIAAQCPRQIALADGRIIHDTKAQAMQKVVSDK